MMLLNWLHKRTDTAPRKGLHPRPRRSFGQTTLPLISPRRGRRILRREQLFSVVRESMIRGGVLSSSYDFKVLTLDANGDGFLVLIELALPAEVMPDAYLLEIERWIQASAQSRHDMKVGSVYWRRKPVHDHRGIALKAAVTAQTQMEARASAPMPLHHSDTAIPPPPRDHLDGRMQPVAHDEIEAFRHAIESAQMPLQGTAAEAEVFAQHPVPESHSGYDVLSETQYGKL